MRRKAERKTSLMCAGGHDEQHRPPLIGEGSSVGARVGTATAMVSTHSTSLAGDTSSLAPGEAHAAISERVVTSAPQGQRLSEGTMRPRQFPPQGGSGGNGGGGVSGTDSTLDTDAADMLIAAYCKAHGWPRYRPPKKQERAPQSLGLAHFGRKRSAKCVRQDSLAG